MVCSRFDLFHTGTTGTPASAARTQARNCAFAWCTNRSPTPIENLPSDFVVDTSCIPLAISQLMLYLRYSKRFRKTHYALIRPDTSKSVPETTPRLRHDIVQRMT